MGVRALQARIICDRQQLEKLWRTHCIFNERLPALLSVLFRMRRGECGETSDLMRLYQEIAAFILARDARDGPYLLNSISIQNWKPETAKKMNIDVPGSGGEHVKVSGESWADRAASLSAQGRLLYDKTKLLGDVPDTIRQMVARECVAIMRSHFELSALWEKEHQDWIRRKAEWEAEPEHRLYLAIRPQLDEFEKDEGKAGKRRERWHKYLGWLKGHPNLAAWRGGPPEIHTLPARAKERIRRARPNKQRSVEAEEFWKANPELSALDRLHGYYEREFVRRRKTKKNPDGFEHRPTFTLPHPLHHPCWFVFNAPQTSPQGYRDLELPSAAGEHGSVKLLLLAGGAGSGAFPKQWVPVRFAADPRLADFKAVTEKQPIRKGKDKGKEIERKVYEFADLQLKLRRPAQISGVKLMFRNMRLHKDGSLDSVDPYLVFTCGIDDVPLTDNAKAIKWTDAGEKRKKVKVPDGLVSCAVDLGIRHVGFATVTSFTDPTLCILRSRSVSIGHEEETGVHRGRWSPGPQLDHIAHHKRELRYLRRLRGKPVKDENSHLGLQDHITHMGEDRFKKAAREIVNFALNVEGRIDSKSGLPYPRADVLILEKFSNLIPDAARERGINKALIEFNRGHLVTRIKEVAEDAGLRLYQVNPFGTSQVCSKCGALGWRYSVRKDPESRLRDIQFGIVEKLFACPDCGYRANSDHNASVNLHRRFLFGEKAIESFRKLKDLPAVDKERAVKAIEDRLRPVLRQAENIDAVAIDLPF